MKSFVTITYYHLLHAVAMALTLEEKANLYISVNYSDIDDGLIEKIKKAQIFNDVIPLDHSIFFTAFTKEMRKTKGMSEAEIDQIGTSIFDKYLEPYYAKQFATADFNDEIFVYNDSTTYYYYVAKYFSNIVGIEEAYGSMEIQQKNYNLQRSASYRKPFVGKYWPKLKWEHPNVKRIISSVDFKETPDTWQGKLEILDYFDIVDQNSALYIKTMESLFETGEFETDEKNVLFLPQPLARNALCSYLDEYLFNRKIIENEIKEGRTVYIKPHPADKFDFHIFKSEKIRILSGAFPVELLNFKDVVFDKIVTFNSTTSLTLKNAKERQLICEKTESTKKEMTGLIQDKINGEFLSLSIYIKANDLSYEIYRNLFAYVVKHEQIRIKLNLLINNKLYEEGKKFYSTEDMERKLKLYFKEKEKEQELILWKSETEKLLELKNRWPACVELSLMPVSGMDDYYLFKEHIIPNEEGDLFLLLDGKNNGFDVIRNIISLVSKQYICCCNAFTGYTKWKGRRISLGIGAVNNTYSGQLNNRLWHKSVIRRLEGKRLEEGIVSAAIQQEERNIKKRVGLELFIDPGRYETITDGEEYYLDLLDHIEENSKEISDPEMKEEYNTGQLGVILSEYRTWYRLTKGLEPNDEIMQLLDRAKLDENYKIKALTIFSLSLQHDQEFFSKREIYQNQELYRYAKKDLRRLLDQDILRGPDETSDKPDPIGKTIILSIRYWLKILKTKRRKK